MIFIPRLVYEQRYEATTAGATGEIVLVRLTAPAHGVLRIMNLSGANTSCLCNFSVRLTNVDNVVTTMINCQTPFCESEWTHFNWAEPGFLLTPEMGRLELVVWPCQSAADVIAFTAFYWRETPG